MTDYDPRRFQAHPQAWDMAATLGDPEPKDMREWILIGDRLYSGKTTIEGDLRGYTVRRPNPEAGLSYYVDRAESPRAVLALLTGLIVVILIVVATEGRVWS